MAIDVIMPQMGESVAEGTIIRWLKKVGEEIEADEPLLEISTDKVDSEIPSPVSGKLLEILASEGETVEVGKIIARIATEEEPEVSAPQVEKADLVPEPDVDQRQKRITPVARRVAESAGLDQVATEAIVGSGFDGRVMKSDVEAFIAAKEAPAATGSGPEAQKPAPAPKPAPEPTIFTPTERIPMDHMRKSIAEHMVQSVRTSPHVTSVHEVDVTGIMDYIKREGERFKQREGVKLTLTSFLARAAVLCLKEFPYVNASIEGNEILLHREINLGIAVALENGLIVPVIRRADELNLVGLTHAIYDLAVRARNKKLNPEEVQGGTFSITNYGVFDTLIGTPIIPQPQVAILGAGAAKQRPVIVDGMIAVRHLMYLSLTYDHRLLDGAVGGRFLKRVTEILEHFPFDKEL